MGNANSFVVCVRYEACCSERGSQTMLSREHVNKFQTASLGIWPTPVQKLDRLAARLGCKDLYAKRDDLSGLGQGGNKTRSLEFLLGDALKKGTDVILTAGGLQSNLCSLTAAACCKLNLGCYLVHNDEKPEKLQGNMLLNSIFGAESVFVGKIDEIQRIEEMKKLAFRLTEQGHTPYIIYNGASTALGSLGYLNAALELFTQIQSQGLNIKHVGIVGAMGGTAAGLVLGTALLNHPFHIHVISVEYPKPILTKILDNLIAEAAGLVKKAADLELKIAPQTVMTVYDTYLGEGYGIPTSLSRQTLLSTARTEGILLEDVYTSKSFGGFLDLLLTNRIPRNEGACFIHTGGLASLFAQDIL